MKKALFGGAGPRLKIKMILALTLSMLISRSAQT